MIVRRAEIVSKILYNHLTFFKNNFNILNSHNYPFFINRNRGLFQNGVLTFTSLTHPSRDVILGRRSTSRAMRSDSSGRETNNDLDSKNIDSSGSLYGSLHGPGSESVRVRRDLVYEKGSFRGVHFTDHYKDSEKFVPHPFNRRFAYSKRPLFPIEPRNLRIYGLLKKKRRGVGKKCNAKGVRHKHLKKRGRKPNSRTFEGGQSPLYKRLPKYPDAMLSKFDKKYDYLNLCKLRYFIERGRLDTRFPITQRHLHDSKCLKVRNGVHLFNVNNYPFPYKIDITVASCDQSSVDVITAVGGSVTIIHHNRLSLRAHVKPYKFEILPKTPRPDIKRVHQLEKFRLMGCNVVYIKPLWLIKEEERLMEEFKELYQNESIEDFDKAIVTYRTKLLEEQLEKSPMMTK